MKEDVISAAEFWNGWERLIGDERFDSVTEPLSFEGVWRDLTRTFPKGQSAGTDTYFAALARAGGWTLVSFDSGFASYPELRREVPA